MTVVKKESHQQQRPTRCSYSKLKTNTSSRGSTGGDTIVIDVHSDTNNNHHGSINRDTMIIEVDMGTGCSDFDSGSNIVT